MPYSLPSLPDDAFCLEEPRIKYIFLELPNCGRALSPQATILDNFCFSLHNMQFLEERPPELRQEIFELLFETANIAKFAPDEKIKYEFSMTTERDIRNQIRYAEKKGLEKGLEKGMEKGMEKGLEKGMEKGLEKGREEAKATNRRIFDELRSKGVDEALLNEVFRKYIP